MGRPLLGERPLTNAERLQRYREVHPEKNLKDTLWRKYKLPLEDFNRMLEDQNGVCAICGGPPTGRTTRLAVDHDHETGRVRALVCTICNLAISHIERDIKVVDRIIEYLEEHKVRN